MPTSIITTDDLREFKKELISEIREMFEKQEKGIATKRWLKSTEVMKILKISPGTLQNFRVNGTLPFTKIGGIIYYDSSDLNEILTANKVYNNS